MHSKGRNGSCSPQIQCANLVSPKDHVKCVVIVLRELVTSIDEVDVAEFVQSLSEELKHLFLPEYGRGAFEPSFNGGKMLWWGEGDSLAIMSCSEILRLCSHE